MNNKIQTAIDNFLMEITSIAEENIDGIDDNAVIHKVDDWTELIKEDGAVVFITIRKNLNSDALMELTDGKSVVFKPFDSRYRIASIVDGDYIYSMKTGNLYRAIGKRYRDKLSISFDFAE